ncbi:hypothetical protein [Desulfogranum marinum]|uniref:hypothetical protein n=1 Tax=Desulfogranum marinum TaxID=453220 RepID=UPI0029C92611|nr:hypothetical protein [Desulfogranum marinum]
METEQWVVPVNAAVSITGLKGKSMIGANSDFMWDENLNLSYQCGSGNFFNRGWVPLSRC